MSVEAQRLASKAKKVLAILSGNVPPCIMHTIVATWCNGWHTDRRFQQPTRACVLCDECGGYDEIEHYLICPFMYEAIFSKYSLNVAPRRFGRLLLVDTAHGDDVLLLACILYGIRRSVNILRAKNARATRGELLSRLMESIKVALSYHATLNTYIRTTYSQ